MGNSTSGRSWPRDVRDLFRASNTRSSSSSTSSSRRHVTASSNHHRRFNRNEPATLDAEHGRPMRQDNGPHGGANQRGGESGVADARTNYCKLNSCPDLQVVARSSTMDPSPRRTVDQQPIKLNVKIYRSYSDLKASRDGLQSDSGRLSSCNDIEPAPLEVRVYRRSTETLAMLDDRRRAQSLPRGMELNRSVASDLQTSSTAANSRRGSISAVTAAHSSSSRTTSRKASARSSMASISAFKAVTPDEFPDSETVRRKVSDFEHNFVAVFCDAFQCLAPLNQLAAISVATRPDRANQTVSLLQYLESDAIPVDLLTAKDGSTRTEDREFFLTIDPARYPAVKRLKEEGSTAVERRLSVARDLASDMAQLAASELGRMFEYQLSLINESIAVRMLARHAVDCILQATRRRSRTLDHGALVWNYGALVRGVIRGRPPPPASVAVVSVFIGNRELKWSLHDVFKKSALRREIGTVSSSSMVASANGTGAPAEAGSVASSSTASPARSSGRVSSQSSGGSGGCGASSSEQSDDGAALLSSPAPWTFHTSSRCDPMRYGYRGQIIEKDYVNDSFRLNSEDEASFSEEVTVRYDDIHRVYSPLRRLASVDTLRCYCACVTAAPPTSGSGARSPIPAATAGLGLSTLFTDFLRRRVPAESYLRDECDVIFRPLGFAVADDFLSRAPPRPADLAAVLDSLADRKRLGRGARGQQGVTRVAIEVTRACDELSGRLLKTNGYDSSAVGIANGDAGTTGNESRNAKALSLVQSTDETITDV